MYMFKAFPVSLHLVANASSNFSISNQFCHEDLFKLCAEHVALGEIVVPGGITPWVAVDFGVTLKGGGLVIWNLGMDSICQKHQFESTLDIFEAFVILCHPSQQCG
jgi:hypothetical protein